MPTFDDYKKKLRDGSFQVANKYVPGVEPHFLSTGRDIFATEAEADAEIRRRIEAELLPPVD